jgi:hypothetical protein
VVGQTRLHASAWFAQLATQASLESATRSKALSDTLSPAIAVPESADITAAASMDFIVASARSSFFNRDFRSEPADSACAATRFQMSWSWTLRGQTDSPI